MSQSNREGSGQFSRRGFLRGVGGVTVAAGMTSYLTSQAIFGQGAAPSAGLRFVHLTDIHLMMRRKSDAGLAACLDYIAKLNPKPQFIMAGGDQCDNLRAEDIAGGKARLDLFSRIWKAHTDLPTYYCLGNHDPVGWSNRNVSRDDPQYGKQLMMDVLGMKRRFYGFGMGGWRFIVLDNVEPTASGFKGEFVQEQLEFVRNELREHTGEPTIVICHIPPISAEEFLGGKIQAGDNGWTVGYSRVTSNPADLVAALEGSNVKCVLSGHIHHVEHIETHGQTFICGGAVSGNWWQGPLRGCPEGFGVVDCLSDGTFRYKYQDFGWKSEA
ncbi:MAG: metallophosphoesterase [Pirellulales bacterium]